MASKFPNVTNEQLKTMWKQTRILRQRAFQQQQKLRKDIVSLTEHEFDVEAELLSRGYVISKPL